MAIRKIQRRSEHVMISRYRDCREKGSSLVRAASSLLALALTLALKLYHPVYTVVFIGAPSPQPPVDPPLLGKGIHDSF
jgi:hypothetical protein